MPSRSHDKEFSTDVLRMLKDREILSESNPVHSVTLIYNISTTVEEMKLQYDEDRKQNPLLETTPLEAWLTTAMIPAIAAIRSNVDVPESVLVRALKRYFQRTIRVTAKDNVEEPQLWTTIEPYRAAVTRLLRDLYDRRKSLQGILGIQTGVRTAPGALSERIPVSAREAIILEGARSGWPNVRIVTKLDEAGFKPRSDDYSSYRHMLQVAPQNLYALKSHVKRKYLSI